MSNRRKKRAKKPRPKAHPPALNIPSATAELEERLQEQLLLYLISTLITGISISYILADTDRFQSLPLWIQNVVHLSISLFAIGTLVRSLAKMGFDPTTPTGLKARLKWGRRGYYIATTSNAILIFIALNEIGFIGVVVSVVDQMRTLPDILKQVVIFCVVAMITGILGDLGVQLFKKLIKLRVRRK